MPPRRRQTRLDFSAGQKVVIGSAHRTLVGGDGRASRLRLGNFSVPSVQYEAPGRVYEFPLPAPLSGTLPPATVSKLCADKAREILVTDTGVSDAHWPALCDTARIGGKPRVKLLRKARRDLDWDTSPWSAVEACVPPCYMAGRRRSEPARHELMDQ